ncbi:MAG: hypothetical protein WAT78_13215 [Rhizobiaceae bacterium]
MSDTEKDKAQEKGDEVLKRMLKTPPKPHDGQGRPSKDKKESQEPKP